MAPLSVAKGQTPEEIYYGLLVVNVSLAAVGTLLFVAVCFGKNLSFQLLFSFDIRYSKQLKLEQYVVHRSFTG